MHRRIGIFRCVGLILAAGLVAGSGLAFAQPANDYHLFGTVKDTKGNPIPDARIVLREKGGWKEHVITTDKNGKYDRWFIPHGVYEARIEKPGYRTLTFEWDLSGYRDEPIPVERHFVLVSEEEIRQQERAQQAQKDADAAVQAFNQGDCPTAVAKARAVLEFDPQYHVSYLILARCAVREKNWDEAIAHYQKALSIKADIPEAHFDLAILYVEKQDWAKALAEFQKAVELKPDFVEALDQMARIYYNQKQWDKCIEAVDRILAQKNDYVWAYRLGGYAWAQKGDLAKAAEYFKKYLELNPNAEDRKAAEDVIRAGTAKKPGGGAPKKPGLY
ncbi:Lipopolysaccharide assembly protein B [bacterium HR11]|nr:Lipopolysaccharide assembly protein B [bacterium HR11]